MHLRGSHDCSTSLSYLQPISENPAFIGYPRFFDIIFAIMDTKKEQQSFAALLFKSMYLLIHFTKTKNNIFLIPYIVPQNKYIFNWAVKYFLK